MTDPTELEHQAIKSRPSRQDLDSSNKDDNLFADDDNIENGI